MNVKLKTCSICNKETYLWKSTPKTCKDCYGKLKSKDNTNQSNLPAKPKSVLKRIKSVSDKKLIELAEYRIVRDKYLSEHPICEFHTCDCRVVELHHKKSRKYYLSDVSIFMSVCREHHNWIHRFCKESYDLGYLLSSLET